MPEYDAFGREIGEDTLADWRSGPTPQPAAAPDRPDPLPAAPTPLPGPAVWEARQRRAAAPGPRGGRAAGPPGHADRLPVVTYTSDELSWGAYFTGGAIFLADARGRITRRIS